MAELHPGMRVTGSTKDPARPDVVQYTVEVNVREFMGSLTLQGVLDLVGEDVVIAVIRELLSGQVEERD